MLCYPRFRYSDSGGGHTAELFAQQLRTTAILAAETDVSRLVIPTLARELSQAAQASIQNSAPHFATKQVGAQHQVQQTVEEVPHARMTGRGGVLDADVECLRERVPKRPASAGKRPSYGVGDDVKREEDLWAPVLAVFRAVDAVLSGGGRSRISFVHREAACAIDNI